MKTLPSGSQVATARLSHSPATGGTASKQVQDGRASLRPASFRSLPMRLATLLFAAAIPLSVALPSRASEPTPEIARPVGTPQAVGAVHTLRGIPEASTRPE